MDREARIRRRLLIRLFVVGVAVLSVGGCAMLGGGGRTSALPGVRDGAPTSAQPAGRRPAAHVVRRKETLSAIAWRYGLDYRSIARWNRIAPPYVIYPGQRLALRAPSKSSTGTAPSKARAVPKKPAKPDSAPLAAAGGWTWPARGRLIGGFAGGDRTGIDIAGTRGQAVMAARAGRVVYTGTGLVGYGRLVIVKHSGSLLTAYAHNDRVLVKEGQAVRAGQKIAEMGSTGADRVKLHFEVRRDGQPLNPLKFLPRRS